MVLGLAAALMLAAPGFVETPSGVSERVVQRAIQRFVERSAGWEFSNGPRNATPNPARRPPVPGRSGPAVTVVALGTRCAIPLLEAPLDSRAIPLLEAPLGHTAPMPVLRPRVCAKR